MKTNSKSFQRHTLAPILALVFLLALATQAYSWTNSFPIMGKTLLHTVRISTGDTPAMLTDIVSAALASSPDWLSVVAVTITCETNDARIAFGVNASNGGTPVGHVIAAGSSIRLPSNDMIRSASIISKTSGSAAILQVTMEY